jgi:hypothetical protein
MPVEQGDFGDHFRGCNAPDELGAASDQEAEPPAPNRSLHLRQRLARRSEIERWTSPAQAPASTGSVGQAETDPRPVAAGVARARSSSRSSYSRLIARRSIADVDVNFSTECRGPGNSISLVTLSIDFHIDRAALARSLVLELVLSMRSVRVAKDVRVLNHRSYPEN